jgi:hypothetical protein
MKINQDKAFSSFMNIFLFLLSVYSSSGYKDVLKIIFSLDVIVFLDGKGFIRAYI